jgi:hypothetical protein
MSSQRLTVGFFIAMLFCIANVFSYLRMPEYPTLDDGFVFFGWPFTVYGYGGFVGQSVIVWTGLIGNVFVALCAARVLGTTVDKVLMRRRASLARIGTTNQLKSGIE